MIAPSPGSYLLKLLLLSLKLILFLCINTVVAVDACVCCGKWVRYRVNLHVLAITLCE